MKSAQEQVNNLKVKNTENELLKNYNEAIKDKNFVALLKKLKISDEVAMKYTSKLETTVKELENCKSCPNLLACKNKMEGCVSFPTVDGKILHFDYVACKYKNKSLFEEKYNTIIFDEPASIKNAKMSDIDLSDKNRAKAIKWVKNFYTKYQDNKNIKGCYLHGSFGSGKTFILAALLNELAKKKVSTTIIYYPEMLRNLKESFYDDFDVKMNNLKKTDILLIDDIGAETVTSWSRDEILGTILQYRMDEKLPTLFTSNLTIDELETHLANTKNSIDIVKAKRIIERIKQLTEDLELVSENRRK